MRLGCDVRTPVSRNSKFAIEGLTARHNWGILELRSRRVLVGPSRERPSHRVAHSGSDSHLSELLATASTRAVHQPDRREPERG